MSADVSTDDMIWNNKILRWYGEGRNPSIRERTGKGGWKILCHGTKTQMETAWARMYPERDTTKKIVSTGTTLEIVDAAVELPKPVVTFEPAKVHRGALLNREVIEPEVLSPETKIRTACGFSIKTSVQWHEAAQHHAQIAVVCAARSGAELNQIKEQCGHGEWQKIVKELPFSADTAKRYRDLAVQLQTRLHELGTGDAFELLLLPEPEKLSDPIYAEQLGQINQVTGEQTLRQLYFDWGIVKPPAKLGGDRRTDKDPKPPLAEQKRLATELINGLQHDIQRQCIDDNTRKLHLLAPTQLKSLEDDLVSALLNVRELLGDR